MSAPAFDNILRNIRKKRGLTQKQLASLVGFSWTTISAYEERRRTPKYPFLWALVSKAGVKPEELFEEAQNEGRTRLNTP